MADREGVDGGGDVGATQDLDPVRLEETLDHERLGLVPGPGKFLALRVVLGLPGWPPQGDDLPTHRGLIVAGTPGTPRALDPARADALP